MSSEDKNAQCEEQSIEEVAAEQQVDQQPEEQPDALDQLQQDLDNAREDLLRAQAEMQNVRRRSERDVENAHKFALEKFVGELLPVVDNLERALAVEDGQASEGIQLTLKSFIDVLARFKVEAVDPAGQPFDPELHQAMSMVPNPDMENNTVLEVFQKGYTLSGRLVRPAMVVVVKN
ncbi:nucleotide exchange factor GrpE [Porticoccaceae bacterium LTM1]|nr:nucleotide exchange factor GrpE [Porticoccaceae bacterium LTM1]